MQKGKGRTAKTIRIDMETYRILCRERRGRGDSFSQVIRRLFAAESARKLADFNRRQEMAPLTRHAGKFRDFRTHVELGETVGAKVAALRPVPIQAADYLETEYGLSTEEAGALIVKARAHWFEAQH